MLAISCEENNHGHNLSNYRVFVVLCEETVIFCQPYNYKNIDMKDKTKFIENKYRVFVKNSVKTYRYFLGTGKSTRFYPVLPVPKRWYRYSSTLLQN